jgi:hypothetical protein
LAQNEEPMMVAKDSSNTEQQTTLALENTKPDVKSKDTREKMDTSLERAKNRKGKNTASVAQDIDDIVA